MIKYKLNKIKLSYTLLLVCSLTFLHCTSFAADSVKPIHNNTPTSILCLGDSITEGGATFKVYRHPLYKKLIKSGYNVKFIGPKSSVEDGIRLGHAGYGGKNAEQINAKFKGIYKQYPADIILIHSAHNYTQEQKPIKTVIASLKSIIASAKEVNPEVIILIARAIPSGKLPKYAYLPKLNQEITLLGKSMKSTRIIIVDQDKGFNWKTDTIKDNVHPNAFGAEKMAEKWFESLQTVLVQQ
ncbi:GDSL-type esterase/lipase family protein [Lentisphaera marina]|uniref:GDSL-type esterase/lipase family protein n=1 Tax=Lentisphaera marina TaxID=1111041 RepID=UPI0023659564|nr:GDSL-type esterase/lipase family protein [Lentisphaera marina]MDD7983535.1 GDSL-type esterase/lipase family protein [Lentisphaera marina]